MGVDCFKTDFGERIPTDVTCHDGSDPERMHNYFTLLYNRTVFNAIGEVKGKENALVFARSATAGSQQFPVHWGGDCSASYESMAESLRGGLSLCLSGFGFWSHDIGGFEGTPTPDLYKRWAAFGLLSSHSRLHGNASFRVPWLFGEEAVEVLRFFTKLKMRLMPYIFSAACEASQHRGAGHEGDDAGVPRRPDVRAPGHAVHAGRRAPGGPHLQPGGHGGLLPPAGRMDELPHRRKDRRRVLEKGETRLYERASHGPSRGAYRHRGFR